MMKEGRIEESKFAFILINPSFVMTFFQANIIDNFDVEEGTRLAVVPSAYEPDTYFILDEETTVEDVEDWIRDRESVAFTVNVEDLK